MHNTITFLASTLFMIFGFVFTSEAQKMKTALDDKQKSIVTISAFTASGNLALLKTALNEGLNAGLTVNEIKEILIQLYAYTGFPRSLNGIHTFMTVMDEREKRGIKDTVGKEATPVPENFNRDQFGAETRAKISGNPVIPAPGGYQLFAPAIDVFLKEHLFADIFVRDTLDWENRELATISALAAMSGTAGQLRFHVGGAMNMGLTAEQLHDFVGVIATHIGKSEGESAAEVLKTVLADRAQK